MTKKERAQGIMEILEKLYPKTPIPQAVKFLNYLQDKDLRNLMKSKDVPNNVSAHARRILTKKGKL